jgi:hypothetical protein
VYPSAYLVTVVVTLPLFDVATVFGEAGSNTAW